MNHLHVEGIHYLLLYYCMLEAGSDLNSLLVIAQVPRDNQADMLATHLSGD